MQLGERTVNILKSMATINSGFLFRKGKNQYTYDPAGQIVAHITIEEDIPDNFGVSDLNNFLTNVQTLTEPNIMVELRDGNENIGKKIVLTDKGGFTLTYHGAPVSSIKTPDPAQVEELNTTHTDITTPVSKATLQKIFKLATVNTLSDVTFFGKNKKAYVRIHSGSDEDSSNQISFPLCDYEGKDFSATFRTEDMSKMILDDYSLEVSFDAGIEAFVRFSNETESLIYFIMSKIVKG